MAAKSELDRFITQQGRAEGKGQYATALGELTKGRKTTHWVWYIFPQIRGLSKTRMGETYGIQDIREAAAYLDHAVLARRLQQITTVVRDSAVADIGVLMGSSIDALKLHGSMTLFVLAADWSDKHEDAAALFQAVLDKYYGGVLHPETLTVLSNQGIGPAEEKKAKAPGKGTRGGASSRTKG